MDNTQPIIIITGSYFPDVCGVGDYTKQLYGSLKRKLKVQIFYKTSWKCVFLFKYLKEIKLINPSLIHMQYPTEGYGFSFLPLLLMLFLPKQKLVLTLHELSSRTFKARIYTYALILMAKQIILTTNDEHKFLKKNSIFKKKRVTVINIGSNIPTSANANRKFNEREYSVGYFGHIRPHKGIEDFLLCINLLRDRGMAVKSYLMGQIVPKYESYASTQLAEADQLNVISILNSSAMITAEKLTHCKILFLPFPDGISIRRGSMMAAALNGCEIVSYFSNSSTTNAFFSRYSHLVSNTTEAAFMIERLINGQTNLLADSHFGNLFSWDRIAEQHELLYKLNY